VVSAESGRRKLRVGAVSYLNTKPLIFGFDLYASEAELILDVPSRLADRLSRGDLDVALIPSIECFLNPTYTIVSDACIACRGPVLSVKLLTRVPFDRIRTLALDEGSRTSVALVQILLQRRYNLLPEVCPLPIGGRLDEVAADAVLLIGDRAIHSPGDSFVDSWDLGAEWCRQLNLPFVFAMWAAREGVEVGHIASVLSHTRDAGVAHLEEIAVAAAATVGLDEAACLAYLRDNLHFTLGAREREGLELFRRLTTEMGLIALRSGPRSIGLSVT
jgi:chorismate dehydratase